MLVVFDRLNDVLQCFSVGTASYIGELKMACAVQNPKSAIKTRFYVTQW